MNRLFKIWLVVSAPDALLGLLAMLIWGFGCATQMVEPEPLIGRWTGSEGERSAISLDIAYPGTNGTAMVSSYGGMHSYYIQMNPHDCPKCHTRKEVRFFLIPTNSSWAPTFACTVSGKHDFRTLRWGFRDASGKVRLKKQAEITD